MDFEEVKRRFKKDEERDGELEEEDDVEVDSEIYGDESDSAQLQKLAADSDEEMQEEGSDIDSDEDEREIIKIKKQ
jgi:hypothetical protein